MGAISPAPALNEELNKNIFNNIIMPTINGMRSDGIPYEGILYAGVMLTDQGPKVIEFNCRFGDPETQVVLPRLSTDLVDIIHNTVTNNLENTSIEFTDNTAITVVIASKGYPGTFKKGIELPSLNNLNKQDDILIFHSGTAKNDNENLTSFILFLPCSFQSKLKNVRNYLPYMEVIVPLPFIFIIFLTH